jgi:hypothetical protein
MALEVEDGTGNPLAVSYSSVADASALHAARNTAAWFAASLAEQEAALIEATDWVDSHDFVGEIEFGAQALAFPRLYAYDREGRLLVGVPAQVKRATILLAADALSGALRPSTAATSGALKRKKVGPLELEYFEGGQATARSFPEVDALLRGLVVGGPGGISGKVARWS